MKAISKQANLEIQIQELKDRILIFEGKKDFQKVENLKKDLQKAKDNYNSGIALYGVGRGY